MSAGLAQVIVGVALPTVSVPPPVEESPVTARLEACTVNGFEPAGVVAVVLMVSVEVFGALSPLFQWTGFGPKEAVAPVGSVVVTLKLASKTPVPLARFTVTV